MGAKFVAAVVAALTGAAAWAAPALGQNEQFIPHLVYRTGAYAPNGIPFANGVADYYKLVNERDGGINGVKIVFEECDTGYATDRGVECYERLKGKGPTGAAYVLPLSTGITFALTEKAPIDKIPIISMGYGRSESRDGSVFQWNFPLLGTYWTAADIILQHIAKKEGGFDKLKGKKIALVYHDSAYGKEPIATLEKLAQINGFTFEKFAVSPPGIEQKSTWLQIRQQRPNWVLMWGWGVMNSTAVREAAAVGYPMDHFIGIWWSGAEPDVVPAGKAGVGYKAAVFHGTGTDYDVIRDIRRYVYDKGQGKTSKEKIGEVLYLRGVINGIYDTEAIRVAQKKFGNKPLTGEEIRWGLENLDITPQRITELGAEGLFAPMKTSCENHSGHGLVRIQQWDGEHWKVASDWIEPHHDLLDPMYKESALNYAKEKNITPRDCSNQS